VYTPTPVAAPVVLRRSVAAPVGLRRSLAGIAGSNPLGIAVCCQVEVSATGRSLVQTSPTEGDLSGCDSEASTVMRTWPTGGCRATKKKV
jgi:hypothetical protein